MAENYRIVHVFTNPTTKAPYAGYSVFVLEENSNNPAHIYNSAGALLDTQGKLTTDTNGRCEAYVLGGRRYDLALRQPSTGFEFMRVSALDSFNADAPVSPTSVTLGGAGSTTVTAMYRRLATLSPAAVAANTIAEQLFVVTGVAVGDAIIVNKPSAQAGLGIVGVRASGANQIGITFSNTTAGIITPTAAETYQVAGIR